MRLGIPPTFKLGVGAYVIQKRPVAHGINRIDVTAPYLFIATVSPIRLVVLADYVAHQVDALQFYRVQSECSWQYVLIYIKTEIFNPLFFSKSYLAVTMLP